ncbi:hypothetical protein JCM14076_06140 [Methylosoma difficile]
MDNVVHETKKTRWGLMLGLFFGVIVMPIAVVLVMVSTTSNNNQPIDAAKPIAPRTFDYLKLVDTVGRGYANKEGSETGEVWTNLAMASMVSVVGAPDKVTKVAFIFPGHSTEDVMVFNLHAIKQLGIALLNDESVVAWVADMIDNKAGESVKVFGNIEVSFKEFPLPKNSEIYLIFTPL